MLDCMKNRVALEERSELEENNRKGRGATWSSFNAYEPNIFHFAVLFWNRFCHNWDNINILTSYYCTKSRKYLRQQYLISNGPFKYHVI